MMSLDFLATAGFCSSSIDFGSKDLRPFQQTGFDKEQPLSKVEPPTLGSRVCGSGRTVGL